MTRAHELRRLFFKSIDYRDGGDRGRITGLEHALRVGTCAARHTGNEMITFMALVHDLGRPLSDPFHGEVIAEMVRDLVDMDCYNVLRTHGQYQAFYCFDEGPEPDTTTDFHQLALHLVGWERASFGDYWGLNTMRVEVALYHINKMCGDRP